MDEDLKQKIALFKYSLIAPIVTGNISQDTVKGYLEEICAKKYELPNGVVKEFAPATVKEWLRLYRIHGIDGLYPKNRSDKGASRIVQKEIEDLIYRYKIENPKRSAKSIYLEMLAKGQIKLGSLSLSTIQRYISKLNIPTEELLKDRRAFEFEFPNECWQSDISVGPYLKIGDKKYKTYIIAILDDASRLVVSCKAFFRDDLISLVSVFKDAIAKRGIPQKLFVDNGKVFKSQQMQLICASLGTILCFAKPYSPQSKGKIERWFRTLQEQWVNLIDWNSFNSIDELNASLNQYVEKQYNFAFHLSIKQKPIDKFLSYSEKLRFITSSQELNYQFFYRISRNVKNDSTIQLENKIFEVPQKYIKQKINIRYDPTDCSKAYVFSVEGKLLDTIYQVKKIDNSKIKRNINDAAIDFSSFSLKQEEK